MNSVQLSFFVLGTVVVVFWIVALRRELRKEYAVSEERGLRSRNLVMMGASATFWVFVTIISSGVDLSFGSGS